MVFDEAVKRAYEGKQKIHWMEVFAGEKALEQSRVTYDLARLMVGNIKPLKTSEFAQSIIDNF